MYNMLRRASPYEKYMNVTLRQVEVFLAVVEEGGFSAAGERLALAQPAVSVAVRKLEQALGLRLLDRTRTGVRLTPDGAVFLRRARGIVAQVAATERELAALRSLEAGHVTLGPP